jgi:hypothetical protein
MEKTMSPMQNKITRKFIKPIKKGFQDSRLACLGHGSKGSGVYSLNNLQFKNDSLMLIEIP